MSKFNQKSFINWALVLIIILLLCTNIATGYYFFSKNKLAKSNDYKVNAINDDDYTDNDANDSSNEEKIENGDDNRDNGLNIKNMEDMMAGSISIEWKEWPVIVDTYKVFDYSKANNLIKQYNEENEYSGLEVNSFLNKFKIYKTGVVKSGEYLGKELFIVTYKEDGPSFRDTMYRIIVADDELILLSNYSDSLWGIYEKFFIENNKLVISNLGLVESVVEPVTGVKLIKDENPPLELFQTLDEPEKLFEYEKEKYIYKNDSCMIARANDGTFVKYYYKFNFSNKDDNKGDIGSTPIMPDITWDNGEKNIFEYSSRKMGCSFGCYDYASESIVKSNLKLAGVTGEKDNIYELADANFKQKNDDTAYLKEFYDFTHSDDVQGATYEDFLKNKPIIFWEDPFGYFIEFRNSKFQPLAECGKPVIYLYPEFETDVSVFVSPTGGLTITEPKYNNGWRVKAKPDGEIYNYKDKNIYPYLFWEGYALNYERPEQGFVIPKENIENFLEEKLSKLGLIKKEYDEFIEFWLPKMQEDNYYFITFVPKNEFDKLAPLEVYPKPDTVIRVYMDFKGLDNYIKVKEQEIITPERIGFTVVEWGGELHR